MALITCPECQKNISDAATACPGCGFPLNQANVPKATDAVLPTVKPKTKISRSTKFFIVFCSIAIIGLFLTSFILGSMPARFDNASDTARDLGRQAVRITDDYLDGRIGAHETVTRLDRLNYAELLRFEDRSVLSDDDRVRLGIALLHGRLRSEARAYRDNVYRDSIREGRNTLAQGLRMRRRR